MHLTLFVPDLLWPDLEHRQAFEFDRSDTLARFLFLAQRTATPLKPDGSWESVLAETFGLAAEATALGAIRLLGEADPQLGTPYDRILLCADPVNLDFIQQALVLTCPDASQLSPADTQNLITSLNEEFADEGKFFCGLSTNHWYFAPNASDKDLANLAACSRLLGRRIDADESRQLLGSNGLRWLNRIQMCLNNHPINEARQMQGLVSINSVWPWGAGLLSNTGHPSNSRFDQAVGDNTLLRGLCAITGTQHLAESNPVNGLLLDTRPGDAIAQDDLSAWQNAVDHLTQTAIAPALSALASSKLNRLTLISTEAHQTRSWTLEASHKGLNPSLIQRCLGRAHKHPDLATLIASW
jgi:hypothetical protein